MPITSNNLENYFLSVKQDDRVVFPKIIFVIETDFTEEEKQKQVVATNCRDVGRSVKDKK